MEATSTLSGVPNGRVYSLTRSVEAADFERLMVGAFSRNVCARVWFVVKWALVCGCVHVSLRELAVIQLEV